MTRERRGFPHVAVVALALVAIACQAAPIAEPSMVASMPTLAPSPASTPAGPSLAPVPSGRILFERNDASGEHYFTIRTDGTDERHLYDRRGCECAHWMADGTRVMTLDATDPGPYPFVTMRPDGTDKVVPENPIKTLSLAPGATTADGRLIAFNGWDDTDPSKSGLYVASPDLSDLRLVLALQEDWNAVEPSGITPDGSRIIFFVDIGSDGDVDHAGVLFVVNADGTGLRPISKPGQKVGYLSGGGVPGSLSPDGRQAAFGVDDAVWVVDLDGGEPRRITEQSGFVWAVSWSPTGEWISYTRFHTHTTAIALVRPDGTDEHEITAFVEADEANTAAWSPDGKYLAVVRDSDASIDGPGDVWIMDIEGRYVGQVTRAPGRYRIYGWSPSPASVAVPAGRIVGYRIGVDTLEHFFTINTDGTDERELFTADGCGCARFSADGTRIVTMGPTGHGTWSLMTFRADGTDRVVVEPPIRTLTLALPMPNLDYTRMAFSAWDDTDHSRDGLYIASPGLSDLSQVLSLPDGVIGMEPFGVTPDGSRVLFFSETGPDSGNTHAGDIYVVDSNGDHLTPLNPVGTKVAFLGMPAGSLSPDGRSAAFAIGDTVYVVDVDGGVARPITVATGSAFAVSWSPTGEWIAYTRRLGTSTVVSLVHPDGTDDHSISGEDPLDGLSVPTWSPDGRHLLVRRGNGTSFSLWIVDLEGTFLGQVTDERADYGSLAWGSPA